MQTGRPSTIYVAPDVPSIYELPEFQKYCKQVERVIKSFGKRGANTGDIHREIGTARQHWTQTALDTLGLERSWTIPTRYKFIERTPRIENLKSTHAALFGRQDGLYTERTEP